MTNTHPDTDDRAAQPRPETSRVGIVQQKGGVAKTTNTINIAGALSHRGKDVLVIDCDPQGYLTNRLGLKDHYIADAPSIYTAFDDPSNAPLSDLIVSHAEFDVLPSNIDMFRLEQSLIASGMKPRTRLDNYLDRLLEEIPYDHVLIDAPPSLGPINDNVLIATGKILVPCEADDSSILALEHLFNQIDTIEENYEMGVKTLGILVSNLDYPLDGEQEEMLQWYHDSFEGHCPIHEIRHRVAIKRSMNANASIFGDGVEECDMTERYLDIAERLINDRFGLIDPKGDDLTRGDNAEDVEVDV